MWSFFKSKKPDASKEAQTIVDDLRSEFSDDVLSKSFALNDRVDRLRSVQLSFFNELLGLTDDTADRIFPIYEYHPKANALEIHGFCASVVAVAVHVSELPKDEKPAIIDIYLDLWVDSTVEHAPKLDAKILKGSIDRMWRGLMPGMMRAAAEEEAVKLGFINPSATLLNEMDGLLDVKRSTADRIVAASKMKTAVVQAMLAVRGLSR